MADNDNHMEKISKIILDLSGEAAFSGEAMKQFLHLKDEVASLESTNEWLRKGKKDLEEELKAIERNYDAAATTIADLKSDLAHYHTRESELQDRESQAEVLQMSLAYEQKRVEDHQNMVGLVFRNSIMRKSTLGTEHHFNPGNPEMRDQYGNIQSYHAAPGMESVPVKTDETETEE